jgi:hypothetical protein
MRVAKEAGEKAARRAIDSVVEDIQDYSGDIHANAAEARVKLRQKERAAEERRKKATDTDENEF